MAVPTLGRLERVELRKAWIRESEDFTPWLAQEENLKLLGDTIGLDLDLEATERFVGPFRADIVCKDTVTDSWVLIENQLERTDHGHLGQLLTYAAGLNAVTIVWVAERFTDEHRAALDWLNSVTNAQINFFGLEVELWRIGNSHYAPKLNVVSQPNDWVKRGVTTLTTPDTDTKALYLDYWRQFMEYVRANSKLIKPRKPQPQTAATFAIGRSGFRLESWISVHRNNIDGTVTLTGPNAKADFDHLLQDKAAIEQEVGQELHWHRLDKAKYCYITLMKEGPVIADRADWPAQHAWILSALETMHRVFAPRVMVLDRKEPSPDGNIPILGE